MQNLRSWPLRTILVVAMAMYAIVSRLLRRISVAGSIVSLFLLFLDVESLHVIGFDMLEFREQLSLDSKKVWTIIRWSRKRFPGPSVREQRQLGG